MGSWFQDQAAAGSLALALPVAAIAGLVSFFSPCVIPLLPGYLSYATGISGGDLEDARRSRLVLGAVLFVLGFSVVFVLLGSLALVKLSSFFHRIHGPTKASTLGVGCILVASILYHTVHGVGMHPRELLITVFLFLTAPVAAPRLLHRDEDGGRWPFHVWRFAEPQRTISSAPVGGGLGERAHVTDDRLQAPVPHPLGEVREPRAIGFDHEEDRASLLGVTARSDLGLA